MIGVFISYRSGNHYIAVHPVKCFREAIIGNDYLTGFIQPLKLSMKQLMS